MGTVQEDELEQQSQRALEALIRKIASSDDPHRVLAFSITPLKRWRNAYARQAIKRAELEGRRSECQDVAGGFKLAIEKMKPDDRYIFQPLLDIANKRVANLEAELKTLEGDK